MGEKAVLLGWNEEFSGEEATLVRHFQNFELNLSILDLKVWTFFEKRINYEDDEMKIDEKGAFCCIKTVFSMKKIIISIENRNFLPQNVVCDR